MKIMFMVLVFAVYSMGFAADRQEVKVLSVHDGDTYTVALNSQSVRVRLYEVDAPEIDQQDGVAARSAAAEMLSRADHVYITEVGQSYDRKVCIVEYDLGATEYDLGAQLTESGMAWYCKAGKATVRSSLLHLNTSSAQCRGIGLWAPGKPPAVEPKTWRENQNLIIKDRGESLERLIRQMNPGKKIEIRVTE